MPPIAHQKLLARKGELEIRRKANSFLFSCFIEAQL